MSNRERIISLLDNVPDYKMGYILAYVQGITADEEADDAFCQRMIENYENDPDPFFHRLDISTDDLTQISDIVHKRYSGCQH